MPNSTHGTPTMCICGNDEEAKRAVTGILTAFGWETEDWAGLRPLVQLNYFVYYAYQDFSGIAGHMLPNC